MNSLSSIHDSRFGGPDRPNIAVPTQPKSAVHRAALWLVWLTIATSAIVFSEPGPVDVLTVGLIVLLPAIGLVRFAPGLAGPLCLFLAFCSAGIFATTLASDIDGSLRHNVITIYLCLACIVFSAFVAYKPRQHTELILNAYLFAALLASLAGLAGIFSLVPGAEELFTKFGRARGTFKDPNVFGPFLIPALVYSVHLALTRSIRATLPALLSVGILSAAILLSLSRGAWVGATIAVGLYLYLFFVLSPRDIDRVKIAVLSLLGMIIVAVLVTVVIHTHDLGDLLADRAVITQTYDVGSEGRFGGQAKALGLLQERPFGIGALEFTAAGHHHENVHNTYLTLFLSNGWLGGFAFVILALVTVVLGFRHALKRTPTQPLFLIVYASLLALFIQALLVDIDHWRHFYLLLGVVWGMMASNVSDAPKREGRIIRDHRPKLLQPLVTIGPTRRPSRIVRRLPRRIELPNHRAQPNNQHDNVNTTTTATTRKPTIRSRVCRGACDPGLELVRKFRTRKASMRSFSKAP